MTSSRGDLFYDPLLRNEQLTIYNIANNTISAATVVYWLSLWPTESVVVGSSPTRSTYLFFQKYLRNINQSVAVDIRDLQTPMVGIEPRTFGALHWKF